METVMKRVSLLAALILAPLAAFADASGTWTATFDTQVGEQQYTFVFNVDGMTLTGTAKSSVAGTENPEVELMEGKVDGDTISFVENLSYQGQTLVINYTGTMTSDDEIQFSREIAGVATEELVAMRVK
jgi:hypothetical protein